ncbi:hypothetical protein BDM02DRAFT_3118608, partial [Thelephora ganbajun]
TAKESCPNKAETRPHHAYQTTRSPQKKHEEGGPKLVKGEPSESRYRAFGRATATIWNFDG